MKYQLTLDDIRNSKALHLYSESTIYVELKGTEDVYATCNGVDWFVKDNFWDYWDSSLMLSYFQSLTTDEAIKILNEWKKEYEENILNDNHKLNKAIIFATEHHRGQFRKASQIPYILHPIEVMQILYSMRANTDVMIAGILHDVVEDTDVSLDEIRECFGGDVADLVAYVSEDKTKTWDERKNDTIAKLVQADKEEKMLVLADKLSNIRSVAYDYKNIGDELWKRFNAPKEKQAWYYSKIQDYLYDMQLYPECADAYWELVGLTKDVFVKYYLDEEGQSLYQISDDADVFMLKKGNPQWEDVISPPSPFSYDILDKCILMNRKDAELLEDIWNKPFWDCHKCDIADGQYEVYTSECRNIDIEIKNRSLVLTCVDTGSLCNGMNGKDEYEFFYSLDEDNTHRLLVQLRMKHGIESSLTEILLNEFGLDNGTILFEQACRKFGVSFFSY